MSLLCCVLVMSRGWSRWEPQDRCQDPRHRRRRAAAAAGAPYERTAADQWRDQCV